jgi:hypothetical protein
MKEKINSYCIATGDLLLMIMGLPVGLLMLIASLFVCAIFGCNIAHFGAALLKSTLVKNAAEVDLFNDLQVSIMLFAVGASFLWVSSKIISAGLRACLRMWPKRFRKAR